MKQAIALGIVICIFTGFAERGFGQTASVGISTDSVLVGEKFFFSVSVRAQTDQVVLLPELNGESLEIGDAEFIRRVTGTGSGASADSATYEVAVFGVDSAMVGGLPIAIIQPGGDTLFFASPSAQVGIRSVVPPDAAGMKDLAPLATFPLELWPWIVGTLLALVASWFIYSYLKKRASGRVVEAKEVRPVLDPYDEAVSRLRSLSDAKVDGEEDVQRYHDELSDILRTYIEKTLALPALERTTGELLGSLHQLSQVATDYVSEDVVARVGETLGLSDMVKFANYLSAEEENRRALDLARESIEDMEGGRRRRMAPAEVEEA